MPLNRCQQLPAPYTNDLSETKTKPTNGLLTDRLNFFFFFFDNRRTSNRPIWLTKDGSKLTNDWWQSLHESFSQYHHGLTDQSFSTDQTYNNIDWQTLFTWLWRWLPLRLSKRQSPTTVLFRTTLTRTITQYELLILLGSNHLLYYWQIYNVTLTIFLYSDWLFFL